MDYGEGGSFTVQMDGPFGNAETAVRMVEIAARLEDWKGAESPFSQVIAVEGASVNSKIDIQLTSEQLIQFHDQVIAFSVENNEGVITLYAIGDKPKTDCTFQATLTEIVTGENTTIIGNTASTTQARADYGEKDESKAGFILNKPDAAIAKAQQTADSAKATAEAALARSGGTMTGPIDMGAQKLGNLPAPVDKGDSATKDYVDSEIKRTHMHVNVVLTAKGWSGAAPYTQTIALEGILATDCPHYGVVYSDNWEAEREAFALVDKLETIDGSLTFTCFEEKPEVDLTIQLEVNR